MAFLKNRGEYETRINRRGLHFRSKRLDTVVKAIDTFISGASEVNLVALETALQNWRSQDPKEYADRGQPLQAQLDQEIHDAGKPYWGLGAIRIVDKASHPKYEPAVWNADGMIKYSTNCYAYACNDPHGHPLFNKPQPGQFAGTIYQDMEESAVRLAVMQDDQQRNAQSKAKLIPLIRLRDEAVPTNVVNVPGYYLIALVTDRDADYHWLRQDETGLWSHKPGHSDATDKDASGKIITDPRNCDLDYGYDRDLGRNLVYKFTTFYYAPKGGVRTGPLGRPRQRRHSIS